MKKITITILTTLILTLTACGPASNGTGPVANTQNGAPTGTLPATTQLIIGTLKLEETENAVTAEQAAELLPLWQTLQVLSDSDTAADQEKEALIAQIQETLTAEQKKAITDMNLTRQDMFSIMQEQGIGRGNTQNNDTQTGNSSNNSGRNFGPGDGNIPPPDERGFPGSGPGFGAGGPGQNLSADQIATAQAARQAGGGTMIPPALINALIELLQKRAGV